MLHECERILVSDGRSFGFTDFSSLMKCPTAVVDHVLCLIPDVHCIENLGNVSNF